MRGCEEANEEVVLWGRGQRQWRRSGKDDEGRGTRERECGGECVKGREEANVWRGMSERECGGEYLKGNGEGKCGGECKKGDEETVVMEKGKREGNCGEGNKEGMRGVLWGRGQQQWRRSGKEDEGRGT